MFKGIKPVRAFLLIFTLMSGAVDSFGQITCTSVPPGIVSWWQAESNFVDIVSGNNGVSLTNVGFAPGKVGTAWSFDGVSSKIDIGDPMSLALTNSFSIEGWILVNGLPPASQGYGQILYRGDPRYCLDPYYLCVGVTANLRFHVEDAVDSIPCGMNLDTGAIPLHEWLHVAATFDSQSGTMQLYTNGQLAAQITTAVRPFQTLVNGGTSIGNLSLGQNGQAFNGLIDELAVYARQLSASEILQIYQSGAGGKCNTPIAPQVVAITPTNQTLIVGSTGTFSVTATGTQPLNYQWSFGGIELAAATNSVLVLNNVQLGQAGEYSVRITNTVGSITVSNIVLLVNPPPPCTPPPVGLVAWWSAEGNATDELGDNNGNVSGTLAYGPGKVGSAFEFDGTTTAIVAPASPSLTVQSATIEAWIFPTDLNNPRPIVEYGDSFGGISPLHLWYNWNGGGLSPGCLYALIRSPGGTPYIQLSSAVGLIPSNQWTHVALAFDYSAHSAVLYVNGFAVASQTSAVAVTPSMNVPVNIGYRPVGSGDLWGGRRHLGGLDEVSIYNRALSAAEISAVYQSGASGKCKTPTAPFVIVPPTNQTIIVGSTASFSIVAAGTQPLSYQWSLAGAALAGATNATLILSNVQPSQAGNYSVQITNVVGSITVSNVVLTVNPAPPCTPPPSGLVSWWQAEGDIIDNVGGNNGVLTNGATFATGEVGQGFNLNGISSYVEIPDSPSLSFTNDFSIELWYKDTGLPPGGYGGLIAKRPYPIKPTNYGLTLIGGAPATLLVYFLDPNYNNNDYQGMYYNNVPPAGVFHHVAVTYHQMPSEQIQIKAYIDGQLVQTGTFPGNLARTVANSPVDIGASNFSGEFFKGIIDEVSLYNKLLSDTDIASIYASASKGKCATPIPAYVSAQPSGQTVVIGQAATFTASGAGTSPLSYQWFFNGAAISTATNNVLVLTNVQMSQAGNYSFQVTNAYGSALSSNATLTVNFPPATVKVVSTSGTAGQPVIVPVVLLANGNENAVGFSLSFPPNLLANASVALGTGAAGASLQFNTNQAGSVGVAVGLPSGLAFAPGTQEVAEVTFQTALSGKDLQVALNFSDVPTTRELSDIKAAKLAANYVDGQLLLSRSALEADVAPRPGGDGSVTIVDWVQVGRYVAALDSPTNASEFQRADCAPRSTQGDGLLTVSDWVQAGRYATGLDPLTSIGGPAQPTTGNVVSGGPRKKGGQLARIVSVQGPLIFQGQTGTATVTLEAQGDENAVGLSLSFDPALVTYTGATNGSDASSATMDINDNFATNGHVGIILELPFNVGFTPGTRQVLKVNFQAVTSNPVNAAIALTDSPVVREVADTNALPVTASYLSGSLSVNPRPSLSIANSNRNISLLWPAWATNYTLQQAVGNTLPSATWTNLLVSPVITNNSFGVLLPLSGSSQFYRLQHE